MGPRLFATDFDDTLARDGEVGPAAAAALTRWRRDGGLLALVTGRVLDDLIAAYPGLSMFDTVVAENGAVLYGPDTGSVKTLADPPAPAFVAALRARGVAPLAIGRVIVCAMRSDRDAVEAVIRGLGIGMAISLNKRSLMIMPAGVDKASGLRAAAGDLGVDLRETVGCGDAENDLPLLAACGTSVAVGNALPPVKAAATIVTTATHGDGVAEAIDRLLRTSSLSG